MLTMSFNIFFLKKKRVSKGGTILGLQLFVQSSHLQDRLSQYTVTEKGNNSINESPV